MRKTYQLLIFSLILIYGSSCKKGYVTPPHSSINASLSVTSVTFYDPVNINSMFINNLPVNFGVNNQGRYGITANQPYALSVVNGQTFNMKLKNGSNLLLDTSVTVAADGIDSYFIYSDPVNAAKVHVYTLHTSPQPPPGKGMAKIRFVNALPGLAGNGSVNIRFSRRQNIIVNNGKPLAFGEETPYIEVPYGTYQPLLLDADNKAILTDVLDLSISNTRYLLYWPPVELKPGGVYTFSISKNFDYQSNSVSAGYLVPTGIKEEQIFPQQPTGKVKFVHVDPFLDDLTVKVDGQQAFPGALAYGEEFNPLSFDEGMHTVQFYNSSGKELFSKQFTVINRDHRVCFVVQAKNGTPDLAWFDVPSINQLYVSVNPVLSSYFNFSPDATPVSFMSAGNISNPAGYSLISGDSTTTNLPYLSIPKLSGSNINLIPGSSGPFFTNVIADNLGVGFNAVNNVVNPSDVITDITIPHPFLEYSSFDKGLGVAVTPAPYYLYRGDTGYHLVMLIGLRYNAPANKKLKIKVIKYVD